MLHVIAGCMFSGKSEELLRRAKRGLIAEKKLGIFKPAIDTRTTGAVASRNGQVLEAVVCQSSSDIWAMYLRERFEEAYIDEAQFFDDGIIDVVEKLVADGVTVHVAGLDLDFASRPFGPMAHLLAVADVVLKLHAICKVCKRNPATRTQRLINGKPAGQDSPTILVGDVAEGYEPRCHKCYVRPS